MKVGMENFEISTLSVDLGTHAREGVAPAKEEPEATTETNIYAPVSFGTNKDLAAMMVKKSQLSNDMVTGVESAVDRIVIQSKLNEINSQIRQISEESVFNSEANIAANPVQSIQAQGVVFAEDVYGLLMA